MCVCVCRDASAKICTKTKKKKKLKNEIEKMNAKKKISLIDINQIDKYIYIIISYLVVYK